MESPVSRSSLLRMLAAGGVGGLVGSRARPALAFSWPLVHSLRVTNGWRRCDGDHRLLATVMPEAPTGNAAHIRFTLDEPASVEVAVVRRSLRRDRVLWRTTLRRGAGTHTVVWRPGRRVVPRTYVVRVRAGGASGRRMVYGDRRYRRLLRPPVVRVLGVEATFRRRSYVPGQRVRLHVHARARRLTIQLFRIGPEPISTNRGDELSGIELTRPVTLDWRGKETRRRRVQLKLGEWPSGLYFARLTTDDGRLGFAPFIVRPRELGRTRTAVVLPTNTWQAYNFRDSDGDGRGDTWYAGGSPPVVLDRPFQNRGVPPRFKKHDRAFIRWLAQTRKEPDFLSEDDLERIPGDRLRALYDLIVFPGHTEYVTQRAYEAVDGYRDRGGNLLFLSANNFFWRVDKRWRRMRRVRLWRDLDRPEATLLGVQYKAGDSGRAQGQFVVRNAAAAPWLWAGTGLTDGATFGELVGGFGTEIDATTPRSPRETIVVAEIPHLFGTGLTAQMTYYESAAGARVFSAGALDFGGSVLAWPMRPILGNVWARLTEPG